MGILSAEYEKLSNAVVDALFDKQTAPHLQRPVMKSIAWFLLAAVFEIAGCYAFWAWLRAGRSAFWILPGIASLAAFAWVLTRAEVAFAGRAYAAYGGN